MSVNLLQNSYGKSEVRLTKVIRNGPRNALLEFSVDVELQGDFAESYTAGDNSKLVATDSMKNTVYVLAKENNFDSAEAFALILAKHFVKTYPQVLSSNVVVRQLNWQRINVGGQPHDHSFVAGGSDTLEAHAVVGNGGNTVRLRGGIRDLLVAKTTRSSFENFVTDRYRTLADAADRIFGTSVSATWHYTEEATQNADYASVSSLVKSIILEVFAGHMSRAVQETMYAIAEAVLEMVPAIQQIDLRLPNKHRIPVNLKPFDLENNNEIFVWTDEPYGDIRCAVTRK